MISLETRSLERNAAGDLWRNTLAPIPTVFGRLVYLSQLRDRSTGRYRHDGLALEYGGDEAAAALRKAHNTTFAKWLTLTLEQQKEDVDAYLATTPNVRSTTIESWVRRGAHRSVLPASAKSEPRKLFTTDFDAILTLLKKEYGVDLPHQSA